jgi:hypothetical protein
MSSNIDTALDEAGKVCKKQKLCGAKVSDCMDKLIAMVKASRDKAAAGSGDAIQQLITEAEGDLLKEMNSSTKELHSSINKLSKVGLQEHYPQLYMCNWCNISSTG